MMKKTNKELVCEYLEYWGYSVKSTKLLYKKKGMRVFYVQVHNTAPTRDKLSVKDGLYVILGYGPPAHFPKRWQNNANEAELILKHFLGNLSLAALRKPSVKNKPASRS